MIKKLLCSVCLWGVLALAGVAQAESLSPDDASIKDNLCLWLRRPEINYNPGTEIWIDLSGRGNDARADVDGSVGPNLSSGENATVFSNPFSAVHFDPEVQELLKATNLNDGQGLTHLTIFSVQKVVDSGRTDQRAVGFGSYNDGGRADHFNMSFDVTVRKDNGRIDGKNQDHPLDEFVIYAARMNPETINMWFNSTGTLSLAYTAEGSSYTTSTDQFYVGDVRYPAEGDFDVAEVVVFNTALTDAQIEGLSEWLQTHVGISAGEGYPLAFGPDPRDGAMLEATWANISWSPGDFAVSHDVYVGDNFDDVNDGAERTFQGNQNTTLVTVGFPGFPFPDGLVPGTTYYWRIDEVNDTEPNSPWKGPVWSFWIQPSKAYDPVPADGAESAETDVTLSWTPGFGAKLHTVFFGDNFEEVNNATGGQSQGTATYTPGPLKMAKTYYWRVDEFDIVETHKGEVWSFTTEGAVESLDPANGAVDVTQTPVLTWVPGVFADTHEVYFGTDAASLELKGSGNLGAESFEPGQLEWNTTYYWRIDEANNTNADSPWTGPLWNFTTANFLIVDDFEAYNDLDPADPASNRIFMAWLDGFDNPAINGSVVGYANPPFAEQTIVHSGNQSMPMSYDNAVGKSEATLTLTSNRDWTVNGINTLTIWFRGDAANAAEPLYAALNNSAAVTNDNPDAAQTGSWTEWNIDLTHFADQGVNLTNVTSITLGLGNRNNPVAGGAGMMYFDDIRLYAPTP